MKDKSDSNPAPSIRAAPAAISELLTDSLVGDLPLFTLRRLPGRVAFPNKATAVVGMRRAGKTTFLHQIRRERLDGGVPRERLPYLNFEDERLAGFRLDDFAPLLEEYYRRYPAFRGREVVTWCFDEIQVVPGWERFIRRLLDTEKVEIFLSGSSAGLLSREIATSMRGRAWEVPLFPFSFEEFLRHSGREVPARRDLLSSIERTHLQGALRDYLVSGGFPEAQRLAPAERLRLLGDYVDVVILRDVVERHRVTNVESLRWLVRHLLSNPGAQFSVERFYRVLKSQGFSVSRDTIHQLIAHLEDCFLVRVTWMETTSERQRMVNPRKVHPVDPALIPVFDRSGTANTGHALETAVRLELERRGADIRYVRTTEGYQVDALARWAEGGQALIQVAAELSGESTRQRELRALEAAAREHPEARLLLITDTPELAGPVPDGVEVWDAAVWLLG
jgi:predicted AAA+ superfamily ATPase